MKKTVIVHVCLLLSWALLYVATRPPLWVPLIWIATYIMGRGAGEIEVLNEQTSWLKGRKAQAEQTAIDLEFVKALLGPAIKVPAQKPFGECPRCHSTEGARVHGMPNGPVGLECLHCHQFFAACVPGCGAVPPFSECRCADMPKVPS